MRSQFKSSGLKIAGTDLVRVSTLIKTSIFSSSLLSAFAFRYSEIFSADSLKHEFFPSIQSTVNVTYPSRSLYQIGIAVLSTVNLLRYTLAINAVHKKSTSTAKYLGITALIRYISLVAFSCIPIDDNVKASMNAYVIYTLSTLVWINLYQTKITSKNLSLNRTRKVLRDAYFGVMSFAIMCYYKHQVELVNGWYSIGSIMQWILVVIDIYFDHLGSAELRDVVVEIELESSKSRHLV